MDRLNRDDYARILRATPDLYLILKPDFTIFDANEARLEATHTTRVQILGRDVFEVFTDNPNNPEATGVRNLRASLERVLYFKRPDAMPIQRYDLPRPGSDGPEFEERYWRPLNVPVFNDEEEVIYILHRVEEVTALVLAERELQRSEARWRDSERRYRLVFETSEDAILLATASGRVLSSNPAACRMFGRSEAELTRCGWEDFVDATDPRPLGSFTEQLRSGHAKGELALRKRGGGRFPADVAAAGFHDEAGHAMVSLIIRDVSERKQAEAALSAANAELRARNETIQAEVARRTQQLELLNQELLAADRYKDEFLAMLSHELRTPLNFIMGFASVLDEESVGTLNPQQHEYMQEILAGGDRMLSLVCKLLDMSRLAAGRLRISPSEVDYAQLLHETLDAFRSVAAQKGLDLKEHVQVPGKVSLDRGNIAQVLVNLVDNAIKFTPPGGRIQVKACRRGPDLVTEVRDTGVGIAPQDLPRLFRRFGVLDSSSTRKAGGMGLGLAICKGIVEAHGGEIGVTSALGRGSTFWFRLPQVTDAP